MRRFRFHLGTLVILVLVLGISFAALRESNEIWDSSVFTSLIGVLLISILLAVHRTEKRRAFWLGFALFGCGIPGAVPGPIDRIQADHDQGAGLHRLQGAEVAPKISRTLQHPRRQQLAT